MAFELTQGTLVTFEHGDVILTGVVNGAPFVVLHDWHNAQAYVPLHVQDGDKNLVVHVGNLVSVKA